MKLRTGLPRRSASTAPVPACVLTLLLFCAVAAPAVAQTAAADPAQDPSAAAPPDGAATTDATTDAGDDAGDDADGPYPYQDELQRDTPRGAMRGYLVAGRDGDWRRAARYLDLSRLSPAESESMGPRLARQLKRVLDRTLWVELDKLPDQPEGDLDDGLSADREPVGNISTADGEVPVRLARLSEDGESVWKISAATVARIGGLYEEFGYGPLEEWLPPSFFDLQLFEVQLWQWVGLALLITLAWALSWLGARIVLALVVPLTRRTETDLDDRLFADGAPPLRFLIGLGLFALGLGWLRLTVPAERFCVTVVQVLAVLSLLWLISRVVDILSYWARDQLEAADQRGAISLVPLGRRTLKVIFIGLGLLVVLQNFGVNVTALVTGLGVGGLAVALAAQKSLEHLFGGIMLAVDQPVAVGEFCRYGDKVGTVEDIGLRSTRIRSLDRTVVSVPNGEFSSLQIENYAKRDRMRIAFNLGLRYETSAEQLRYVLVELRKLLLAHPRVLPDPARVRFVGFGAFSLDLEVFAYVDTEDYNDFLAVREDLFLRMMGVVEASGSDFAFPSQTLYVERGSGLDGERVSAVEAQVQAWREAQDLQLPDFREDLVAELDDSLDYPPRGSAARRLQETEAEGEMEGGTSS